MPTDDSMREAIALAFETLVRGKWGVNPFYDDGGVMDIYKDDFAEFQSVAEGVYLAGHAAGERSNKDDAERWRKLGALVEFGDWLVVRSEVKDSLGATDDFYMDDLAHMRTELDKADDLREMYIRARAAAKQQEG